MSRIPNPSTRSTPSSPAKSSLRPSSRTATTSTTSRIRPPSSPTPTLRKQASSKSLKSPSKTARRTSPIEDVPPVPKVPTLSIKEQIALKRAEAQKAKASPAKTSGLDLEGLEDALPVSPQEDMFDLGRWSVKETIERARSSALFEIHLGITPEPLKLVPVEPPITNATSDEPTTSRRKGTSHQGPSWYEAQDLEIIKAWSNEIVEVQPEINMFGSLKTIDLHNNKLTYLPDTFADLTALTILDLSHNQLQSLPTNLWALPNLTTLNLSHNVLVALPFSSPFTSSDSNPLSRTVDPRGDWYGQNITRAVKPLPKLTTLDVSYNCITAQSVDHRRSVQSGQGDGVWLPEGLMKLDLSFNPLGESTALLRALSLLKNLQELKAEHADIGNNSFPANLFSASSSPPPFARLTVLDIGETHVTKPAIEAALLPNVLRKTLDFDITAGPPKAEGVLRVIVGKKIIKEAWEIEAERRVAARLNRARNVNLDTSEETYFSTPTKTLTSAIRPAKQEAAKEAWEIEAEQGLLTEGAKRRARALAATHAASPSTSNPPSNKPQPVQVQKEPWEIEAEMGLLTAGGRRRARAAAMAASLSVSPSPENPSTPVASATPSPTASSGSALSNPQYYNVATQTLTLPASVALTMKNAFGHARSFSFAPAKSSSSGVPASSSDLALAIPTPTLPLAVIAIQSFASTLKSLILNNRRMDPSFNLPLDESGSPFLPQLEELSLQDCNLGNTVSVSRSQDANAARTNELLLPLLVKLFPNLRTLDLSYNNLTSDALGGDVLSSLILATNNIETQPRKGLRHLRLRGNKLSNLDGFISVSGLFKGHKDGRDVESWKLEELDVRDNEIGRLPPELGLLPLDVLLVDGNVFRVPPRRVWEREGTKGLLGWLRGRIE
ncbi:unnamed protein product [Somion occarium]|uniref:Leucine-rich repeat-containing protein 40 n=1 Tax=Somion occarium TaxID=3059160 RepID=A0ABP1EBY6_9APHY